MSWEVVFSRRAERQLDSLFHYIEARSGVARADGFVSGIVEYCRGLSEFPERGVRRDDIRPDLRIVGYRRRVAIAFIVEVERVVVLGVYYAGRDYEWDLRGQDG